MLIFGQYSPALNHMKILIAVNTLETINQPIYSNHAQFYFRLGRDYPHHFALFHPRRMTIDRMRNEAAKAALGNEMDYLMFIDDDVLIPHDALAKLLVAQKNIIAGWTIIRGYPFQNMFFKWIDDAKTQLSHYPHDEIDKLDLNLNPLLPVAAVGFSCVLINCDFLRKINPPYFVTGPRNTEDVYFCLKAQQQFPNTSIFVHLDVKTAHLLGSEAVDPLNRQFHKTYYESVYPDYCNSKEDQSASDRGDAYLEMVKNQDDT